MSSRTPRRLPWEILLLVFKEADVSTLAVLGRVSYDVLVATAPDLYTSVTVESLEALKQLFCEREEGKPVGRRTRNSAPVSRINSLLSLSQIQTLSITLDSFPPSTRLSSSRLDDGTPIPLDSLHLSLPHSIRGKVESLTHRLLLFFNPLHCHWNILARPFKGTRWVCIGRSTVAGWTRLEQLDIKGGWPVVYPAEEPLIAGLPFPSRNRRRVVRLHHASLICHATRDMACTLDDMQGRHGWYGLDEMQEGSMVIVVGSEEEKTVAEQLVATTVVTAPWRRVFAVEVEEGE